MLSYARLFELIICVASLILGQMKSSEGGAEAFRLCCMYSNRENISIWISSYVTKSKTVCIELVLVSKKTKNIKDLRIAALVFPQNN